MVENKNGNKKVILSFSVSKKIARDFDKAIEGKFINRSNALHYILKKWLQRNEITGDSIGKEKGNSVERRKR